MYQVKLPQVINKIMECYYRVGYWHRGDDATARETLIKLFYSIYYLLFLISVIVGALTCVDPDESVFLGEASLLAFVLEVKLLHIVWRKRQIVEFLHQIGVLTIADEEQFNIVNGKVAAFMKFIIILTGFTFFGSVCCAIGIPIIGSERKQVINIGFPFDWRTSEIVFWLEFAFISSGFIISFFTFLFSVIMWYLLFVCALKYDVLANRFRNIQKSRRAECIIFDERKISETIEEKLFVRDLIDGIDTHMELNE